MDEQNQSQAQSSSVLEQQVKGLYWAIAALVVCTLALAYGMYQQNKTIVSISSSAEQLAGTVEVMIRNEQITRQISAEFEEWSTTDEGKNWLDAYLQSTYDPESWEGYNPEEVDAGDDVG